MDLVFVFAASLAFYCATLAPAVIWGDSAWLAVDAYYGALNMGTAGDHPLFVFIGHLLSRLPFDVARLVNFEAALFGALAVTMVYRCSRQLGTSRAAAGAGAAALCVSHGFWLHSVIAEVYTANAFFLAATLSLLIEWQRRHQWRYLAAASVVFAIGLTNHLVLASMAPAAAVFVATTTPRRLLTRQFFLYSVVVAAVLAGIVIAAFPVGATFHRLWVGPPSIWEYFGLTVEPGPTAREVGRYFLYLAYQFPSIALPLGFFGIWVLLRDRRAVAALFLMTVAVNAGIFIHRTDWESATKFVFYIADYVVFGIWCAVGADEALRRLTNRSGPNRSGLAWGAAILAAVIVLPVAIYEIVPRAATRFGLDLVHATPLPYRDDQRYFLNPNKHGEDGARRYATEALQIVMPAAVVFADYTPGAVLRYLKVVKGVRPDVILRFAPSVGEPVPVQWVFDGQHRRPVYLASLRPDYYDLRGLTGEYDLIPAGPIFEVRPRDVR
jgi:hypothetical protein